MQWYKHNTIVFLSINQQLNDLHATITHNVAPTTVEQSHFSSPHPQPTLYTPSPVHQCFGQTHMLDNETDPQWMTNLFGVDVNTPNSVAAYLASFQQFDHTYSFAN